MDAGSTGNARGEGAFLLITCEHGGNRIPAPYQAWFAGHEALLASHRGYDAGALAMALARRLEAPLVASVTSRLLVELNRSLGHRQILSNALHEAPQALREEIIDRYYRPYRRRAIRLVEGAVAVGRPVIHISSHSFTPVLDGKVRDADIGLLYDPSRPGEVALCDAWQAALAARAPDFKIRRNYPYAGKSDGFCTGLRRQFPPGVYAGIELEVNQKHFLAGAAAWRHLRQLLPASLAEALGRHPGA